MSDRAIAMVFEGAGRPLSPRHIALPRLRPGEVLVRTDACTLCGSDLHTYEGRRSTPCPTILGHEIVGRIEALPEEGTVLDYVGRPLSPGDRIVWSLVVSCEECFYCLADLPQKCERLVKYGHEAIGPRHALGGGLATHCHLLAGTAIFHVPEKLPDLVACPASCATATVVAALRQAGDVTDQVVLVQGAGMLGLTAAALARSRGAAAVVVSDTNAERLALADRFGATHLVRADAAALKEALAGLTDGRGADVALELSGSPAAIEAGMSLLRIGGRYVWVGAVYPSRPLSLFAETVVRQHLTIAGVHNYHPRDLDVALTFLDEWQEQYPFAELVSSCFSLEQAEEAFRHASACRPVRVAVTPA